MDNEERMEQGTETAATESESGQITLDEAGELNIPEDFWDGIQPEAEAPVQTSAQAEEARPAETPAENPAQVPAHYTPEELAEAFANGEVDPARLAPELRDYYGAIDAAMRRQADAQQIREQMATQQVQPPAASQAQAGPKVSWAQMVEASKVLAARNYLGIPPEEFDEFDPQHAAARNMAMQEIRDRAQAMAREQVEVQRRYADFAQMYAGYRQQVPDIDEIGERYFPVWRQGLTVREHEAVNAILASGDMAKTRALLDRVVADYRASKAPPAQGQAQAVKPKAAPPEVVGVGNVADASPGMVDVSDLGDMTPDQQAEWLIRNKFAI